jgi:hypothetical protein
MSRKVLAIALVLLISSALGYTLRSANVERVHESAQKVLDTQLAPNTLKVDQLHAPSLAFVPFLGPSSWRSYLSITEKSGRPLNLEKCPTTVDYEVRLSITEMIWVGDEVTVQVNVERLQECSDALKANR